MASSPSLADALEPLLRWTIVPTLCDLYGFEESDIRMKDLFFVKYEAPRSTDADGDADADAGTVVQDRLSPHRDGTLLSFNVLLSEPRVEFSGGGTRFASLGEACSACGGAGEGAGAVASDVASCEACDADGSGSASGEGACEACEACPVCFGMGTEKLRPVNMGDLTLHCGKLLRKLHPPPRRRRHAAATPPPCRRHANECSHGQISNRQLPRIPIPDEGAVVTEGIRYIIVGFVDVFNMETVDHEFLKCYRAANTSRRSTEIDYECATRAFLAPA